MGELSGADREGLRQMIENDWVEASLARDWDASLALCSQDFVYMPQDHRILHGRSEAKVFLEEFPSIVALTQAIDHIAGDTDLAVFRGRFDLTVDDEGQRVSGRGKFLGDEVDRGVAVHSCLFQLRCASG